MRTTAVIPTIGRTTLENAVNSAIREGLEVIVVCDGKGMILPKLPESVQIVVLGKRFGSYGAMAYNVGACLAKTEFIVSLADDDELGLNFGSILSETLEERPTVDIWIPQLVFNDGGVCCDPSGGHQLGNICAPIFRVDVLSHVPFRVSMGNNVHIIDFQHLGECIREGYILDWQPELKYLVRPLLPMRRGLGIGTNEEKTLLL